jgi:hypothetical protein
MNLINDIKIVKSGCISYLMSYLKLVSFKTFNFYEFMHVMDPNWVGEYYNRECTIKPSIYWIHCECYFVFYVSNPTYNVEKYICQSECVSRDYLSS